MYTKNIELFPLAKTLVELQQKKLGFTINSLIITNTKENKLDMVGGCYNDQMKTIMLNLGGLAFLRNKYGYTTKNIGRIAAAVLFEECYHAAHYGTTIDNEDLAAWYGSLEAAKLPEEILTINQQKEETKMKLKDVPVTIVSGSMFNFVNTIASMNIEAKTIGTTYGNLAIKKEGENLTVNVKTNPDTLERLSKMLGNVTNASIEYSGMVYIYQKEKGWKAYVDVDDENMVEIDMEDNVEAKLTGGKEPCLEVKAG